MMFNLLSSEETEAHDEQLKRVFVCESSKAPRMSVTKSNKLRMTI